MQEEIGNIIIVYIIRMLNSIKNELYRIYKTNEEKLEKIISDNLPSSDIDNIVYSDLNVNRNCYFKEQVELNFIMNKITFLFNLMNHLKNQYLKLYGEQEYNKTKFESNQDYNIIQRFLILYCSDYLNFLLEQNDIIELNYICKNNKVLGFSLIILISVLDITKNWNIIEDLITILTIDNNELNKNELERLIIKLYYKPDEFENMDKSIKYNKGFVS